MYDGDLNKIEGWMSPQELEWLFEQAFYFNSIVEIGAWKGRSSHALLSGCRGKVYCVDHFQGNPNERDGAHREAIDRDILEYFSRNVGHFKNLVLMEMDSLEAAKFFKDKSVDMVFIDGGHDFASIDADLTAWIPKCRHLICGHDMSQDGVPEALKKHFPKGHLHALGGIWMVNLI